MKALELPWYTLCQDPVQKWGWFHYVYIIIGQGFISAGISFGLNYGLAILVFRGKPPPTMWYFPLPMAGDYGVLAIIETLMIYMLSGTLIMLDVKKGMLAPLDPCWLKGWWPNRTSWVYWYLRPPEILINFSNSDLNDTTSVSSTSSKSSDLEHSESYKYALRIYASIQRAIPWIIFGFFSVWPWFVIGTFVLYGNNNYNSDPQPEYLSALIGGVLAFILTPVLCLVTLTFLGDQILLAKSSIKLSEGRSTMNPMFSPTETDSVGFQPTSRTSATGPLPFGFAPVEGVTFASYSATRPLSMSRTAGAIGMTYTSSTLTLLKGGTTTSSPSQSSIPTTV